jgi:DNA-binding NarL/FixJ family response regulator
MQVRVVLVEDLMKLRALLEDLFQSLGGLLVVATLTTEAEARQWFDEHPDGWDLAIVDLVLEQGSGLGILGQLQALPHAGRVVVFSSYVSPGIREHCLRIGADAVFDKADTAGFIGWLSEVVLGRAG